MLYALLDPGLRWGDDVSIILSLHVTPVIPAQAGIQSYRVPREFAELVPAYARMTKSYII